MKKVNRGKHFVALAPFFFDFVFLYLRKSDDNTKLHHLSKSRKRKTFRRLRSFLFLYLRKIIGIVIIIVELFFKKGLCRILFAFFTIENRIIYSLQIISLRSSSSWRIFEYKILKSRHLLSLVYLPKSQRSCATYQCLCSFALPF